MPSTYAQTKGWFPFDFESLTPGQLLCWKWTKQELSHLLTVPDREQALQDVVVCLSGYADVDRDEVIADNAFSSPKLLYAYNGISSMIERFDFLLLCIRDGGSVVQLGFEDCYLQAMRAVGDKKAACPLAEASPKAPELLKATEEQVRKYRSREDWPTWREKLRALEDEQNAVELARRDRVFGHWAMHESPQAAVSEAVA
ncbi:hypothetical protein DIPPA_28249 [Diplonema papillatum]|nr:hypothetical protein DIPPA_28249 [Diplonema papillatum]|eukprot:gene21163-32601_t